MMTNADYIRAMTNEQLEEFIEQLAFGRETPWSKPFADKYCMACPVIEAVTENGIKMQLSECDFVDGKCPHGSDILWWLMEELNEHVGLSIKHTEKEAIEAWNRRANERLHNTHAH